MDEYVDRVSRALRRARLNHCYPDARKLSAHVAAMGHDFHQGLYDELEIDPRSGLPTYKEWTRVQTDREIARTELAGLGSLEHLEERAARRPDSIHGKQLLKHLYYEALLKVEIAPLAAMDVALRRVDADKRTAHFHVVLDKLDATGVFVRFSVDLAQTASAWSKPVVVLEKEDARHTEGFRSLIYRFTAMDAELTHVKLAALGGLAVERITKGTIGPFYHTAEGAPEAFEEMLCAAETGAMISTYSLDMVAPDLAQDRDNDPLEDPLSSHLTDEGLQGYERARKQYGYKVFKDRKFVVSADLVAGMRTWCRDAGTKNIIYKL